MIPTNPIPTHPGVILLEEFLEPMNLQTNYDLALNRPKQIKEAITFYLRQFDDHRPKSTVIVKLN